MQASTKIRRTYITLTVFSTLSTSFIWGINTLFLLDAGLSNTQAFTANAFFTLGQVIFEVPTGVVADVKGRKLSFLLGAATLLASTLFYLYMWQVSAPFWAWAIASALIGLGFTFFSGAIEAWLVDALNATGYDGPLESVFARAQVAGGIAMLTGSVLGGFVAQATNLGVPYILRSVFLAITFVLALLLMHDIGFSPNPSTGPVSEVKRVFSASVENGWRNRPVKWIMLSAPFTVGVSLFAFYAMQPYLLELYGDPSSYGIAGLAAAVVAGAQILGGLSVPVARKIFLLRTHALIASVLVSVVALIGIGITTSLAVAVALLVVRAVVSAAASPLRQALINGLIPSSERATVLSFDSLMGSSGGVALQPALGRSADLWGYGTSYVIAGAVQLLAVPFLVLARRENTEADVVQLDEPSDPVDG